MRKKAFGGSGPGITGPCSFPSTIFLLLLALFLLVGGCGKKLAPLSPDAVLPAKVRDFRLAQEGDALVLTWLLPTENLLGQPLTQIQGCRILRAELKGVNAGPPGVDDFVVLADIDLAYPQVGEVRGERVLYQDRNLAPERRYFYRVAAYDQEKYPGAWSRTLSHAWGRLPRAPQGLKVVPGDRIVRLSWPPVTQRVDGRPLRDLAGYRIYRRTGEEGWSKANPQPVTGDSFQDVAVLNDVEYSYKVRTLSRVGPDFLESGDSPVLSAMPEKRTPPPPVLNLVAVAGERGVELRWDPSPAPDVAGYRIYRRQEGEVKFILLTPTLLTRPAHLDETASRGRIFYYYITAVDTSRRANESIPSEEAGISY
ncbi:MAG: fibronectin type III domain-containing protein [Thermodesulfobacteriota bacterium]